MTEQIAAQLETIGGYVAPLPEAAKDLPCFVHHEDAGGRCEKPAAMQVYGIHLCEAHGTEARAACLSELFQDATDFLERYDNDHVPETNPAAMLALRSAVSLLLRAGNEAEDQTDEAVRRAYADVPGHVMEHVKVRTRDCNGEDWPNSETFRENRVVIHKLMRQAFDARETWLVETLEKERESVAAHLSAAMENEDRVSLRAV